MKKRLVIAIVALMTTLANADLPADTITMQLRGTVDAVKTMQILYDAIPSSYPYLPTEITVSVIADSTEVN